MKTYRATRDPSVVFDKQRGVSLPLEKIQDDVAEGRAVVFPFVPPTVKEQRKARYAQEGLNAEDWLEAIIEFLGELPNPPEKFRKLWEKREKIRGELS